MATFTVNGQTVTTEKKQKLLRFLRDELRLTSAKEGCSVGACGTCTAVILWQAKRVLDTILKGTPFVMDNAKSMRRAAICCFLISGAAFLRLIWGFVTYKSILPLLTYNALFVPIFLMGGLLFLVMSALFRQAAELKAENDLTI